MTIASVTGYLKSYLYRLNITDNNKCTCRSIETPKHLLLECRVFNIQRKKLLKNIGEKVKVNPPTLKLLLYTGIGIKEILVFLKETNICTRKRHIRREADEEIV